jgi:TPR repeat protein
VQSDATAMQYFARACAAGAGDGCHFLGIGHRSGLGVKRDAVRAAKLFQKACDLAWPRGCLDLGLSYQLGRGVPKNGAKADKLYRRAESLLSGE